MVIQLLLIAHIVGDFLLQSGESAQRKNGNMRVLIRHSLLYAVCMWVAVALVMTADGLWIRTALLALVLPISHFIIDLVKAVLIRREPRRDTVVLFIADQVAHVIFVIAIGWLFQHGAGTDSLALIWLQQWIFAGQMASAVRILLLYLICLQPAAVFVRKLLNRLGRSGTAGGAPTDSQENAGQLIGMLERATVLTLGLMGQLGAIGLIIAAKSVARFNQLSTDKEFAERYLVGTLASVLIALFCVFFGTYLI